MDEELFELIAIAPSLYPGRSFHVTNWPSGDVKLFKTCISEQHNALAKRFGVDSYHHLKTDDWICPQRSIEEVLRGMLPYLVRAGKWYDVLKALQVACAAGQTWACELRQEMLGRRKG
jgi:hypothetical protein